MAEEEAVSVTLLDHPHKRKLDDLEPDAPDVAAPGFELKNEEEKSDEDNGDDEVSEPGKRPRLEEVSDDLANENGHKLEDDNGHADENAETTTDNEVDNKLANEAPLEGVDASQPVSESEQKLDATAVHSEGKDGQDDISDNKDAEIPSFDKELLENVEKPSGDELQMPATGVGEKENAASDQHQPESGGRTLTRRMEIPNNKVGVLIGKSGDTIKYLQLNSGAKIQITRDADAEPSAPTRPVELVGTVESLNKAERLIKDVIAEADAGGSPSLIARGFTASMSSGAAEIEMPVQSDKVGLIIGKGGETIRSLQARSGARIQLIPQSSAGDQSKEKKVKVTGDKKQVEIAIELIKEVMNQLPGKPAQLSGNNYNNQQHGYRPRGQQGAPFQWNARGPPAQSMPPYDGHQRGPYPSHGHHYPHQPYGNYPPPRGGFGGPGGWDNRPPAQGPPPHHSGGGYDYYGQTNAPSSQPTHHHASGPPPSMAPPHSQANYNYGQPPRGTDYALPTPYPQTAPTPQGYGHGYGEPKYDHHGQGYPPQQQQGGYAPPQQQQGYAPPQQQYNRPPQSYGVPPQGAAPPTHGYAAPTPTASQPPTDGSYQAPPVSGAPQPYAQPQQPYQQAPYGSAPMANTNAYGQTQSAVAPNYPQQSGAPHAAPYGGYAQAAVPTAGYGQYPQAAAQPGYVDPAATGPPTAATYGYPGQVDPSQAAYGTAGQVYAVGPTVAAQQGYAQQGYDQSAAQSGGYASAPVAAAAAYGKTTVPQPQPQPGYAPQYDASQQMYAAPPR